MTCIVSPHHFPTKKALRLWVMKDPELVEIVDPSIVSPRRFIASHLKLGEEVVVTNHPKRSWFAQVGRKVDGTLYVK